MNRIMVSFVVDCPSWDQNLYARKTSFGISNDKTNDRLAFNAYCQA